MIKLVPYAHYSRQEVHDIFSPDTTLTPQAGTWGLQGIVQIPGRDGDFVFFVTFGQKQANHVFEEGITTDGVLTWQSPTNSAAYQSQRRCELDLLIPTDLLGETVYLFG